MPPTERLGIDILCIQCSDGALPCTCPYKDTAKEKELYALARDIVERRTLTPAYLTDDEDWYAAVDEAKEALGIAEKAPICKHCGDMAPYGDERHHWIGWHYSFTHRWWQRFLRWWPF